MPQALAHRDPDPLATCRRLPGFRGSYRTRIWEHSLLTHRALHLRGEVSVAIVQEKPSLPDSADETPRIFRNTGQQTRASTARDSRFAGDLRRA